MRIVIDLQGAQGSNRKRGIGRYSEALALHICKHKKNHDIHIVLNNAFAHCIDEIKAKFIPIISNSNIHVFDVVTPSNGLSDGHDDNRHFNEAMREAFIGSLNPDFVLITSLFEGLVVDTITSINKFTSISTAVVLYDLIPYINPIPYLENPTVSKWYLKKINHLKKSDVLLSISASSGQEAIQYLGFDERLVTNISTACDSQFVPLNLSKNDYKHLEQAYNISKPFVMYTGGIDHRKNIEGLIRAFAALPKDIRSQHQLAIVCSVQLSDKERLTQLAKEQGLTSDDYIMTGFVPDEDLVKLYNACKLFIFPSWHEGFGLPALEAMQCGAAVIASNNSSLPEVIGLEEALFDPRDDKAITEKLLQGLTDEKFHERLIQHGIIQAKKFNWSDIANRAIEAIEIAHSEIQKNNLPLVQPSFRPRLAYLSPLPPERSGISDYSAELLEELTRWYDIDVIVDQETVTNPWILATIPIRDVAWFLENSNLFDRVLYHFGNSEFHKHMFDLLPRIPGVVVLHDFYLSGVQAYREGTGLVPHAYKQNLYHSHGYNAVYMAENEKYPYEALWTYPTNLKVIQDALGVIVHSENSKNLAVKWYGEEASDKWIVIPLLRKPLHKQDKIEARKLLNLVDDDFIICSFGMIGNTKLSLELVEAYINSKLAQNKKCHLILVGQKDTSEYGKRIDSLIQRSKLKNNITITGWIESSDFRLYLQAADIAVQLRTLSRGESSAAILDCMNAGLPTIVNANGSMTYLDKDSVLMIPDEFQQEELSRALDLLFENADIRQDISKNAFNVIRKLHNPMQCANQYFLAIEEFYRKQQSSLFGLINHIKDEKIILNTEDSNTLGILANNLPANPNIKSIYIDVSELVQRDSRTGIQRVVRSILTELLRNPPVGYRIEPVYGEMDDGGYRYARKFTRDFLKLQEDNWTIDSIIEYNTGDIFLGLDLQHHIVNQQFSTLKLMKSKGVKLYFVVYDLLPILQSEHFVEIAFNLHTGWLNNISISDGLICISRSVADELYNWLQAYGKPRYTLLSINWFHLGSDIGNSIPTKGLPDSATNVIRNIKNSSSFLMVGTLEPRKGHAQVLAAFEKLWEADIEVTLVIIGKMGWKTETLAQKIRTHQQLGKRLFWLEAISDEYLEKIYEVSSCLIAASYGEGFGLPIIEAAQHNLPVIARDIPVFREVAGNHAVYFDDSREPKIIAEIVQNWLALSASNKTPDIKSMPWLNWEQSTQHLLDVLLDKIPPYKTWLPDDSIRLWGHDPRLHTQIGKYQDKRVLTTDEAGFLLYGPHLPIKAGNYEIKIEGNFEQLVGSEYIDITCEGGTQILFKTAINDILTDNQTLITIVGIEQNLKDFELRVWVDRNTKISISDIILAPITKSIVMDADSAAKVSETIIVNTATLETTASQQVLDIQPTGNSAEKQPAPKPQNIRANNYPKPKIKPKKNKR